MVKEEEVVDRPKVSPETGRRLLAPNNDSFGRLHTDMQLNQPQTLQIPQLKTNEEEKKEYFPQP